MTDPNERPPKRSRQVVRRRANDSTVERLAAPEPLPVEVAPPQPPRKVARAAGRPSLGVGRLERFRHRLGNEPDHEIAAEAGVSRSVVLEWRKKHGIPAYQGFRTKPRKPRVSPPAKPARTRSSAVGVVVKASAPEVKRLRAYTVRATANGVQRDFFAVGADMADACGRAQAGFATRADGPWLVDEVTLLGEALA